MVFYIEHGDLVFFPDCESVWCKVCQLWCANSVLATYKHLDGKKHLKNQVAGVRKVLEAKFENNTYHVDLDAMD